MQQRIHLLACMRAWMGFLKHNPQSMTRNSLLAGSGSLIGISFPLFFSFVSFSSVFLVSPFSFSFFPLLFSFSPCSSRVRVAARGGGITVDYFFLFLSFFSRAYENKEENKKKKKKKKKRQGQKKPNYLKSSNKTQNTKQHRYQPTTHYIHQAYAHANIYTQYFSEQWNWGSVELGLSRTGAQ